MGGKRTNLTVALCLGAISLACGVACSAEDPMTRGRGNQGNVTPIGTAASGAVAGAAPGTTAGVGGSNDFGNPTGPARQVGDGTPRQGMCLQPTVAFLIDGSGSMCAPFGGGTRWSELRKILLDPMNGLIYRFQNQVDFGMTLYDGNIDFAALGMMTGGTPSPDCAGGATIMRMGGGANQCPNLVQTEARRTNAQAIDMMYPMRELGGSTPTDKAMNAAVDKLIMTNPTADPKLHPKFIILATDGQPNDICTGGLGGDGLAQQAGVVAAVERAYMAGIRTYVISLADDPVLQQHLTTVAMRGDQMNPAAHTYSPMTPEALLMDMKTLLGNALGCAVM
jgi:hypothetical protein